MELDEMPPLESVPEAPKTEESKPAPVAPSAENNYQGMDDEEPEGSDDVGNEDSQEEEDDNDPWKGYVDVEINGKVYKVPEDVKDGYMRLDDYTRKRQADAELKRQLEARQVEIEEMGKVSEEELQARSAKLGIDGQLKQYETVDWQKEYEDDPFKTQQHFMRYQQLKDAAAQIDNFLGHAQNERVAKAEQEYANRLQETRAHAQKNLKGWTPELDKKLETFVTQEMGYSREEVSRLINPKNYELIYLAHIGKQTLSKQAQPPRPKPTPPPLTTVASRAGSSGRKSMSDMSMEEYATYRQAQLKR